MHQGRGVQRERLADPTPLLTGNAVQFRIRQGEEVFRGFDGLILLTAVRAATVALFEKVRNPVRRMSAIAIQPRIP